MGKKHLLLLTAILPFFIISAPVSAQQANQDTSNLQQQQTGTQTTGTPQTDTAPVQQNGNSEALSQNQPDTLGVVSNPAQATPSVTVGPSSSTNLSSAKSSKSGSSAMQVILILIIISVFIIGWYYRPASAKKETSEVKKPAKVKPGKKSTKTETLTAEEKTEPTKKKVKKTKKKKKKTTHR